MAIYFNLSSSKCYKNKTTTKVTFPFQFCQFLIIINRTVYDESKSSMELERVSKIRANLGQRNNYHIRLNRLDLKLGWIFTP